MKKFFALALSLALALTAFAGCSSTSASASTPSAASGSTPLRRHGRFRRAEPEHWEGMFPQEVLDAFTAETGIKVNYSSFDTDETMLAKLETAKGGDYDVVIADDYIIETAIAEKPGDGAGQKQDRQHRQREPRIPGPVL
jgi:spermidine/putrescine transport system substrate-binding protein